MKLAAYANRLSVRPGEVIQFHVASATGAPVATRVVHVACADPNPAIGGVRTQDVRVQVDEVRAPSAERVPRGSYALVGGLGGRLALRRAALGGRRGGLIHGPLHGTSAGPPRLLHDLSFALPPYS